jgi:hypothetical protein
MMRLAWCLVAASCGASSVLAAQSDTVGRRYDATLYGRNAQDVQRTASRRTTVHYGKWLTAGAAVAFTVMAAQEHRSSTRYWDQLMSVCRSADTACALGSNGRYQLSAAESLYQRSVYYDHRASYRLLGAQASLLLTAALFILDRRPGEGPENIPFAPLRVTVEPTSDGAVVGMRIAF